VDYSGDFDGVRMQKLLAGMHDRGATAAVVEASTEAVARGWMEVGRAGRARAPHNYPCRSLLPRSRGMPACTQGVRAPPTPLALSPLPPQYVDVDVAVWTGFEEDPRHVMLHGSSEVGRRPGAAPPARGAALGQATAGAAPRLPPAPGPRAAAPHVRAVAHGPA
jgi:hypothetical protein